jgi:arginase family enzyme
LTFSYDQARAEDNQVMTMYLIDSLFLNDGMINLKQDLVKDAPIHMTFDTQKKKVYDQ